jgi:cytochrome b561
MTRLHTQSFTATAKWLHWLTAVLMLSLLSAAWEFAFTDPADRAEAIPVHVSIGLIIVALTLARLAYRRVTPPPALPGTSPGWVQAGAKWGHRMLYGLILFQAILGLWMAAASPVAIRFFNGANISALAPANPALIETLRPLHFAGAVLFCAVLFGHVAGALWHHFKLRDDVLLRMTPFTGLVGRVYNWSAKTLQQAGNAHGWPTRRWRRASSLALPDR